MQNQTFPIADLVAGKISANTNITTRGWVRTRRDSKAGFSFIVLYDGSGFQTIQVVAPKELNNYEKRNPAFNCGLLHHCAW